MSASLVVCCPTCKGQRTVSKPSWIAGDVDEWATTTTETYPCPTCHARGYLVIEGGPSND